MVGVAQVCVGLGIDQVAMEGFCQIQPQLQDFRYGLKGVITKHQTKNTPINTHLLTPTNEN